MRSAEWQVAAAVAADFTQVAASGLLRLVASGPLHRADSGQQALQGFVPLPADSDQVPASARSVREPAVHLLLQVREHFHRGLLYPATMCL
jgi:hypothetical protein